MECVEQNYGSTLVFCVGATEFDKSDKVLSRAQVKVRTFEAESLNLSNHGHWKCDFTETRQQGTRTVDLGLSLKWASQSGAGYSQESLNSDDLISQIKSIKVRSDTTLSELLVDKVNGQSILEGDAIQELKGSAYLLKKMAGLSQEQKRVKKEGNTDHMFECTITEFNPVVFRVMLQYMYTGKLALQPHNNFYQQGQDHNRAGRCSFEDLYRIAERYEIQSLKESALKAIRHTLNMSIAISLLTKISLDDLEGDGVDHAEKAYQRSVKNMAMDIVKEYIVFFGTEIFVLQADKRPKDLSIRERHHMISHLGENVLTNLGCLWTA
ncbi:hypothetical protein BG000_008790 [Podila horticola]|nr:hypothetical protein BG000_008790 [Podila horticola]